MSFLNLEDARSRWPDVPIPDWSGGAATFPEIGDAEGTWKPVAGSTFELDIVGYELHAHTADAGPVDWSGGRNNATPVRP